MVNRIFLYLFIVLVFPWCCHAQASWFIKADKFHVSVHGQLICTDCHSNIGPSTHPNPADVNKSLNNFFNADQCAACHQTVDEYAAQKRHGQIEVTQREDIENCISCHDPHYELRNTKQYNPALPVSQQCGVCHEIRKALPKFDNVNNSCMQCHQFPVNDEAIDIGRIKQFCFHCHGVKGNINANFDRNSRLELINIDKYKLTPHADMSCLACHPDSARFPHSVQQVVDCGKCHFPHDEKMIHDTHSRVTCQACHLPGRNPIVSENRIVVSPDTVEPKSINQIHQMNITDKSASCNRCHFSGNNIGAAAMVLPAKSLICMPCHTATFSADDKVTITSLIIFILGMVSVFFILLAGRYDGSSSTSKFKKFLLVIISLITTIFSRRIIAVLKAFFVDVLLQRRLFKQDRTRWIIHGLIFYPFVLRFSWGLITLFLSLSYPQYAATQHMLNKNFPVTALFFDVTGIIILSGIAVLIFNKKKKISANLSEMPMPDWAAMILLGAILIGGFILEGMRIAMTGNPPGSSYAFLGYAISFMFTYGHLINDTYGYIWYLHAILTGLFLAYLPFSRMMHILIAPIMLSINALKSKKK